MATRRTERVAQLLKQEICRILAHRLHDPRLGFLTVTRVELPPDLRSAKVYVSVLGQEVDQRKTMAALAHARGHIQAEISGRLTLRHMPVLSFLPDQGVKHSLRVSQILSEVQPRSEVHLCEQEPTSDAEGNA